MSGVGPIYSQNRTPLLFLRALLLAKHLGPSGDPNQRGLPSLRHICACRDTVHSPIQNLTVEFMSYAVRWMELEVITLSEINPTLKNKYHTFSLIYRI
jgi:hypothetical protein